MEFKDLKVNMVVKDSWWPWKYGRVTKKLKTVMYILMEDGVLVKYDKSHVQFLREDKIK